ncbi:MAG: TonB-dependent receptor [Bacteroidales bacterium]|nr:TonB-dependent receptor [Bacteroidales bacterium]
MKSRFGFLFVSLMISGLSVFAQKTDTITAEQILAMSFDQLMDVEVVSASRYAQKSTQVPATIKVISAEQIKERAYFTLDDVLSDLPGFQFRNILGFNSYSFLRGVPSQNNLILVMINGVEINELNSGGFYGGGHFNLINVDRIEVVYGPASVVYGTNAVSGIINIITLQPEKRNSLIASTSLGNFETSNVDFSYQHANENFGILLSAMLKHSNKANLTEMIGDNNWTNSMENFENDQAVDIAIRYKNFNYGLNFQEKKASRTTNYRTIDDKYYDQGTLWDIVFLNTYVEYAIEKGKNTFKSRAYYRNATVKDKTIGYIEKSTDTTSGKQVGYYRPNFQLTLENQYMRNLFENLHLVAGIDLEYEQLAQGFSNSVSGGQDIKPPKPVKPEMLTDLLLSLYAQGQYTLSHSLLFTMGVRQDFSDYYGNVFTPRSALVYNKSGFTGKLMYNEAFRAPKPWDFTSGLGNNSLNPEKMSSTELSLSYILKNKWMFESNIYFNKIRGLLSKETTTEGWYWNNKDEITTIGVEWGVNYNSKYLNAYLNYSYNDSQDQLGDLVPEIADHTFNSGFTAYLFRDYRVHMRANYLGSRNNPENNLVHSTGSFVIDDAIIFHSVWAYTGLANFEVQLVVNNLFNTEYYHTSNRPVDRYRQPQRSIKGTIIFKLEN